MSYYDSWPKYVPVAVRRANAEKEVKKRLNNGQKANPIVIEGRKIARTFWGEAWCNNLELYSDYANRLPRGRTYVRNGSVVDLQITQGRVKALVSGSELYEIDIVIEPMVSTKWKTLVETCTGQIESLIELLQGKFSKSVMGIITQPTHGLFPHPQEIKLTCSCPDWADMCKHVAATLYGVGALLDKQPELLFTLRQVDHLDLIGSMGDANALLNNENKANQVADDDLSAIFGIELDSAVELIEKKLKPKPKVTIKKEVASKPLMVKKPQDSKSEVTSKIEKLVKVRVKATTTKATTKKEKVQK